MQFKPSLVQQRVLSHCLGERMLELVAGVSRSVRTTSSPDPPGGGSDLPTYRGLAGHPFEDTGGGEFADPDSACSHVLVGATEAVRCARPSTAPRWRHVEKAHAGTRR